MADHPKDSVLEVTLTEFLLARIAEDEAEQEPGYESIAWHRADCERFTYDAGPCGGGLPARVLAECEAKRRVVELATFSDSDRSAVDFWLEPEQRDLTPPGFTAAMIGVLQALAVLHADHPDYRQEWKP